MNRYGRIIGVDVGTKHVGLARTDLLRTIANPIGTYSPDDAFAKLEELARTDQVEKIVVGWPLTPEGKEGAAVEMVEQFLEKLHRILPDMEVDKIDERYTSKEAVQVMVESGVPKMKRRESDRINRAAAAIILQKYLNLQN
ncbi:MAG: Holliday junction resolvase RuvX [Balneolaceae bacterium]|nr:Holliday junction resolvase RuvX [Balneolaceae bacterium]